MFFKADHEFMGNWSSSLSHTRHPHRNTLSKHGALNAEQRAGLEAGESRVWVAAPLLCASLIWGLYWKLALSRLGRRSLSEQNKTPPRQTNAGISVTTKHGYEMHVELASRADVWCKSEPEPMAGFPRPQDKVCFSVLLRGRPFCWANHLNTQNPNNCVEQR